VFVSGHRVEAIAPEPIEEAEIRLRGRRGNAVVVAGGASGLFYAAIRD
jgi:hypothetical protein